MQIHGTRCVVTGSSSGIGQALTELLLKQGAFVVGIDHQTPLSLPSSPQFTSIIADLAQPHQVQSSYDQAKAVLGEVDLYIANAGQARYGNDEDLSPEDNLLLWNLNVMAVIEACRIVRADHDDQPFALVVLASAIAKLPLPGYSVYGATKAALAAYIQGIRYELSSGQSAHLVYPAATSSNFFSVSGQRHRSWFIQSPHHVAQRIVKGLQSNRLDIYPSRLFRFFDAIMPFALRIYTARESAIFQKQKGKPKGETS